MALPLGALTSLTGGGGLSGSGGAATSGDSKGGVTSGSGISSPVVIGGFKSDGTASALPGSSLMWIGAALLIGAFLYFRRK